MDKTIYDRQYWKFSTYGFLKNLRFFDPFIVLFFLETGLNFLEIGILISFREIVINIFEIPSGLAADTFGRRKSMIISFSAYIISFIIFFTSGFFATHLVAMFFYAVGEAFRSGTHKALILEYLKQNNILEHKVHYYGHTRSWSQMGSAVSAVIAGTIVFFSPGYRFVFLFSIIPYILGLFLIWSYPVNLDFSKSADENPDYDKLPYRIRMLGSLKEIILMIKGKSTRRVFINNSIFDAVFKSIKDYLQPVLLSLVLGLHLLGNYSEDEKVSILSAFVYFILFFITSYAAKFSGHFANLFQSEERSLNFSFIMGIILILCIGLFIYLEISLVSVILFILLYIIQNIRKPVTVGVLSSRIPSAVMASGLSVESQLKTIMVAVFAPVLGFMMDIWGVGLTFLFLAGFLSILYPFIRVRN